MRHLPYCTPKLRNSMNTDASYWQVVFRNETYLAPSTLEHIYRPLIAFCFRQRPRIAHGP